MSSGTASMNEAESWESTKPEILATSTNAEAAEIIVDQDDVYVEAQIITGMPDIRKMENFIGVQNGLQPAAALAIVSVRNSTQIFGFGGALP